LLLNPEVCVNKQNTKILLTHGEEDKVIPIDAMRLTEEALNKAGISVETAVSQGLAHGIDGYLLNQAIDFLKRL
jgi:phospholipase/carboxylesterase